RCHTRSGTPDPAPRNNLKEIEEQIVAEPAEQTKLAGLSGNSLLEAKTKIFEFNVNYLASKAELNSQANAIAHIRTELFQADKHWKEAVESLAQARKEEKEAEENTHGGA